MAVVVIRVGWGSGAAHVHVFVVVWEVCEEVGAGGRSESVSNANLKPLHFGQASGARQCGGNYMLCMEQ